MDKIKIKKIIPTVILFLICCFELPFYGCQKEEQLFELSENAQIYTFDSNNLMKLSEIIVEQNRLIYKFDKRNQAGFTPDKILDLINEKDCKIFMVGENLGFYESFEKTEIIKNGQYFYLVLYYDLTKYSDAKLSGFQLDGKDFEDSFIIEYYDLPYISYNSYDDEIEYIQKYNNETWTPISFISHQTGVD